MEKPGGENPIWSRVKWGAPIWQLLMALERVSSLHPLAIIARKRLDISFFDFAQALRFTFQDLLLPGFDGEGARQKASLELSCSWEVAGVTRSGKSLQISTFETDVELLLCEYVTFMYCCLSSIRAVRVLAARPTS